MAGLSQQAPLRGAMIAGAIWALHLVFLYALTAIGCTRNWDDLVRSGPETLRVALLAATLLAWMALAWLAQTARRRYPGPESSARFAVRLTRLTATVAAIAVALAATPVLLLPPCSA